MKLNTQNRTIQRSGPFRESKFRIAANAHAFEILSSRLYTDTMLAIVRELSTNAADAHVEAGCPEKPFDVHLPNYMEPFFAIRDYGTGLSPEDVEQIYTTYFESTRNNSDDFTGALGLGSKSPFSYTDMFTVVSYFNGKQYTYSAFKGETGEPSIALMQEQNTDEPNGLEIRIDTKQGDEYDFKHRAQKVYRVFDPRPNITGARIEFQDYEPVMSDDGWNLYDTRNCSFDNQITVVMGNVAYAADRGKITHNLGYYSRLVLDVPIGEFSIAANREELQYDERTTQNLQKLIDEACTEIRKQISNKISHCQTLLARLIALKEYTNLIDFSFEEKVIPTHKEGVYRLRKLDLRRDNKLFIGYDRFNGELRPGRGTKYVFVECDVEGDLKQKHKNALRHWMRQRRQGGENFYLMTIYDRSKVEKIFGKSTAVLSQLPPPPRVQGGGGVGGPRTFVKVIGYCSSRISESWDNVDNTDNVDTQNGIAVPRQGYKPMYGEDESSPQAVKHIAGTIGYTKVYGLPKNRYEKLRKELGLKDLYAETKKALKAWVDQADDFQRASYHHRSDNDYGDAFLKKINGISDTCSNLVKYLNTDDIPFEWRRLLNHFGLSVPEAPDYLDIFRKTYPLIASVNLNYTNMDDVIEYIKLKEKNKS